MAYDSNKNTTLFLSLQNSVDMWMSAWAGAFPPVSQSQDVAQHCLPLCVRARPGCSGWEVGSLQLAQVLAEMLREMLNYVHIMCKVGLVKCYCFKGCLYIEAERRAGLVFIMGSEPC